MLDNLDLFYQHEREQQRWLDSRPVCTECGEPIQSEYLFDMDGTLICPECIVRYYRQETEEYI